VLVQQGQAELSQARVERSLAEEAQQALEQEIRENVATYTGLIGAMNESVPGEELEALGREYRSLQREAALIGALDPEMEQEYSAVTERVNFYRVQIDDLSQAIQQTTSLLRELDQEIKQKGEGAFEALAEAFARAFKELFKGGQAALKLQASSGENEGEVLMGVEIEATPPGKKLKSLALLSGGERALTALALLMAIMETNPAPFILLDEVDAALDEANTRRFADMLAKLKEKTQFLVITHNRATMEVGDALYGVNMGRDGTSRLISVTLADYGQETTARR
jgi:chromosome segregation protein